MEIDRFLQTDFLEQSSRGQDTMGQRAELLLRIANVVDRMSLNLLFHSQIDDLASTVESTTATLRAFLTRIDKTHLEAAGLPVKRGNLKNWRHRFSGKKYSHLASIPAIMELSGVLDVNEPVHLLEPCSGAGMLSVSAMALRSDAGSSTYTTAIDLDPRCAQLFTMLNLGVLGSSDHSTFLNSDIRNVSLAAMPNATTFCLSKHACGPATGLILDNVLELPSARRPESTTVMTCCHGKAQGMRPEKLSDLISVEDWDLLAKTADWTRSDLPEETKLLGRVAMRVMDCLRLVALPDDVNARVTEAVDFEVTPKNHVVTLAKAA